MDTYFLHQGSAPLLISLPHDGSWLPAELAERMHPFARRSPDTDWHVSRLYGSLAGKLGASLIRPKASRYVIDLNRPADGHKLYPGQRETGLVSTISFAGEPLYLEGMEPDEAEVQQRINDYWKPYHQALAQEVARLRREHGRVVVWEGHSIRTSVPMLFEGELPELNLGTADGASCEPSLEQQLRAELSGQKDYSFVVNGRFKGGYITRHFGQPGEGVQAVQLELAQHIYMDEESFAYDEAKAPKLQEQIERLLRICLV
ncbi:MULTISPECIES: N-formylglutamate deformylase [Dyella]|uniref:N-formylglutamate deformylase n=2 Tax=Dyella TaxID=231454 RepID=A0A4R0YVG7_9GAMM|nr:MULTISPECIES: N-formylglutamate deformylase [Dyella]TBR39948.1 N-formylglutamate deformylase [Dyella terrae]TCI12471.1 N-formylglutamate deformylase [Dyella soli]